MNIIQPRADLELATNLCDLLFHYKKKDPQLSSFYMEIIPVSSHYCEG